MRITQRESSDLGGNSNRPREEGEITTNDVHLEDSTHQVASNNDSLVNRIRNKRWCGAPFVIVVWPAFWIGFTCGLMFYPVICPDRPCPTEQLCRASDANNLSATTVPQEAFVIQEQADDDMDKDGENGGFRIRGTEVQKNDPKDVMKKKDMPLIQPPSDEMQAQPGKTLTGTLNHTDKALEGVLPAPRNAALHAKLDTCLSSRSIQDCAAILEAIDDAAMQKYQKDPTARTTGLGRGGTTKQFHVHDKV